MSVGGGEGGGRKSLCCTVAPPPPPSLYHMQEFKYGARRGGKSADLRSKKREENSFLEEKPKWESACPPHGDGGKSVFVFSFSLRSLRYSSCRS